MRRLTKLILAFLISISTVSELIASDPDTTQSSSSATVSITFFSDRQTFVSAVGPQNIAPRKFSKTTLELPPGDYKVMGRKFGYEIVALVIRVREGYVYAPIEIICATKGKESKIDWEKVPVIEGTAPKQL